MSRSLFFVEVPTGQTWAKAEDAADVAEVLTEEVGAGHTSLELTRPTDGRARLAVTYLEADRVPGIRHQWRNYAAERLAIAVCEPGDGPVTIDEFYGPAVFHAVTDTGADWLSAPTAADLATTAAQLEAGEPILTIRPS